MTAQAYELTEKSEYLVGKAKMTYLFWDVYDIELYTPTGQWPHEGVFELSLIYYRELDGKAIAERAITEMRKQGFKDKALLQKWLQQMTDIFPTTYKSMRLTGVKTPEGNTVFYRDKEQIGEVLDPLFTEQFFAIWLGEKTSEPKLRKQLLGRR